MKRRFLSCCFAFVLLGATAQAQEPTSGLQALMPRLELADPSISSIVVRAQQRHMDESALQASQMTPQSWRPRSTRLNWIDYSILAATGAAAVVAVHYKFKADDLYRAYLDTGDPTLRPRIRSLDTRSAVALGTMQAGVVTFGARLLLR